MIIVTILGILAAIVMPEFQGHIQKARESQAKANLKILREAIERYAAEHNGIPPGYPSNNPTSVPTNLTLNAQFFTPKTYLSERPKNPFNDIGYIYVLNNTQTLNEATAATIPSSYGWLYHPATKTVKLHWTGTDSEGVKYFNY